MSERPLSLFEGYGIEIESMIVDRATLDVRPVADEVLRAASEGTEWVEDHDDGPIGWSNELVSHVLELKTNGPAPSFEGLARDFEESFARLQELLAPHGSRLMPGAMHPWMDPARETRLWPHDHGPVYRAFDRLFDCRRHGWANLQSVHLNLPFADEREFGALLAAIRVALPLIPALAASSPVVEGRATGLLDSRLVHYRANAERAPSLAGRVIPEPAFDYDAYRERVFAPIRRELEVLGADRCLLDREWTNARGAIARFDRMAIEIRLIDVQEGPRADLAVAAAVAGLVRGLVDERWSSAARQRACGSDELVELLGRTTERGPAAELGTAGYAELFGLDRERAPTAGHLWNARAEETFAGPPELEGALDVVLGRGTLAERLLASLGAANTPGAPLDRAALARTYGALCDALREGRPFPSEPESD